MASSKITTVDLEEPIVEALNTIDTVADQVSVVDNNVNSIKSTVESNANVLDTINTNTTNVNTRLTSIRAGYLDYLANSTYGLSALKTAIGKIPTTSGGGYMMGEYVEYLGTGTSKSYTYPVFVVGNQSAYDTIVSIDGNEIYLNYSGSDNDVVTGPYLVAPGVSIKNATNGSYSGGVYIYKAITA